MTFISEPNSSRVAIGIDVVAISRIKRLLNDYPTRTREFVFTEHEKQYCEEQAYPAQHYAARWAVKEAFFKSLNESEFELDLTSIEIVSNPVPRISLTGRADVLLSKSAIENNSSLENTNVDISMTHENQSDLALGMVLIYFESVSS